MQAGVVGTLHAATATVIAAEVPVGNSTLHPLLEGGGPAREKKLDFNELYVLYFISKSLMRYARHAVLAHGGFGMQYSSRGWAALS